MLVLFRFLHDHNHPTRLRIGAAATAAMAILLVAATGASANPSIDDKKAQAAAILGEIAAIEHEVGAAAERYNGANYELGKLTAQLREARIDLARARDLQRVSNRRVASRLRQLYISGESAGTIEVVLGAKSLDELLDRIDVAERVAGQDAKIAEDARRLRKRITQRERQLDNAHARQAVVVAQREREKRAIEQQLAEREQLLSSVKDEIATLEAAERRRQEELRRQAAAELARQQREAAAQLAQAAQAARAAANAAEAGAESFAQSEQDDQPSVEPPAPTPAPAPPADASRGAQVVAIAMRYLGVPYVWASADPSVGFDCSGLTKYVFAQIGVSLPHYAAAQYQLGAPVSREELQPGDLVFFRGLGHMGMYIGGGNMIHAPRTGDVVKISSLSESYYVANWVGARRVL